MATLKNVNRANDSSESGSSVYDDSEAGDVTLTDSEPKAELMMIPGIVLIMNPSVIPIILSKIDEYTTRVWTCTVQYSYDTAMI